MDLQKDWLAPTGGAQLPPCRWTVNIKGCQDSKVITIGYGISTGSAGLIIILLLIFIFRRRLHRQWGKSLIQCPPLLILCALYILCMACFMVHGIIILTDPPSPYWVRELIRSLSFFFLFNAPVPHIIHLITIVARIDMDTIHYGLRRRTIRIIVSTVPLFLAAAGLLSILAYLQIDHSNPLAYKWLYTCSCILYIYPCLVIAWFYQAYAVKFTDLIDVQLSEFQYCPSHPWDAQYPSESEEETSHGDIPNLAILMASLEKMKSLYTFAMIGIGWSIIILVIAASLPNGEFGIPVFRVIMFFGHHVSTPVSILLTIAFLYLRGFPERSSQNEGKKKKKRISGDQKGHSDEGQTNTQTTLNRHWIPPSLPEAPSSVGPPPPALSSSSSSSHLPVSSYPYLHSHM